MTNGFPWGGLAFPQDEWRQGIGEVLAEGVIADRTGTAVASAPGSGTTVSWRAHRALVQGVQDDISSGSVDVSASGSNPTSGQTRIDRLCWRYNPTAKTLTVVLNPGSPATTGSAVPPTLTRSTSGNWDVSIATITRTGTGPVASGGVVREHAWVGPHGGSYLAADALPGDAPQGSTAFVGADLWERYWDGSAMAWRGVTNPDWVTMGVGPASSGTVEYTRVGGFLLLRGAATRLLPPGYASPTTWSTGSYDTLGILQAGYRPAALRRIAVTFSGSDASGVLHVDTDGTVSARALTGVGTTANSQNLSLDGVVVPL